jgi:hypothetical protein
VVTVILERLASGWAVALAPLEGEIRPDAVRRPWVMALDVLLLSLPLAEAAELGTPRAEARLYMELTLARWLALDSEMDDRPAIPRAGSGR